MDKLNKTSKEATGCLNPVFPLRKRKMLLTNPPLANSFHKSKEKSGNALNITYIFMKKIFITNIKDFYFEL